MKAQITGLKDFSQNGHNDLYPLRSSFVLTMKVLEDHLNFLCVKSNCNIGTVKADNQMNI